MTTLFRIATILLVLAAICAIIAIITNIRGNGPFSMTLMSSTGLILICCMGVLLIIYKRHTRQ